MPREIGRPLNRISQPARLHLLDQQGIERARQVGGEAQTLRRPLPDDRGQRQQPLHRLNRRRDRLVIVDRVERAADAVVELGIADGDQSRQQQSAAARPHERLGDGPHRKVVGQQDPATRECQRVPAMPRNQPGDERIGERAM